MMCVEIRDAGRKKEGMVVTGNGGKITHWVAGRINRLTIASKEGLRERCSS